ncbi:ABC transporter permease [Novipirellula herctigrandis]
MSNPAEAVASEAASDGIAMQPYPVTRIRNTSGSAWTNWVELYRYRDLFQYLVRREIKVRYAQSAIGVGWAVLQPLFTMLVFTVIFGRLAKLSSDGAAYALFSFAGLVPWMFFSNAVTDGVNGLISGASMMSKVYFPRMLMPLSANAARMIDFVVASVVMSGLMLWYGVAPNWGLLALPWILAVMALCTSGVTLWLATFAIQFRDVKHALGFIVQILMYAAPVVYPASLVPDAYQRFYAINPMVGVIEGIRAGCLGTRAMPWDFLLIGTISAIALFGTGVTYFNSKQRVFADLA